MAEDDEELEKLERMIDKLKEPRPQREKEGSGKEEEEKGGGVELSERREERLEKIKEKKARKEKVKKIREARGRGELGRKEQIKHVVGSKVKSNWTGILKWIIIIAVVAIVGVFVVLPFSQTIMNLPIVKSIKSKYGTILGYTGNRTASKWQREFQAAMGGSQYKVKEAGKVSQKSWEGPSAGAGAEKTEKIKIEEFSLTRTQFSEQGSTMAKVLVENMGKTPVKPAEVNFRLFSGGNLFRTFKLECRSDNYLEEGIEGGERTQFNCNNIEPRSGACGGYEGRTRSFIIESVFKGGYHSTARLDLNYIKSDYADTLFQTGGLELEEKKALNSGGPVVMGILGPKQPIRDSREGITLSFAMGNNGDGKLSKGKRFLVVGIPKELYDHTSDFNCHTVDNPGDVINYSPLDIGGGCKDLKLGRRAFSQGIRSTLLMSRNPYKGFVFCPTFGCGGEGETKCKINDTCKDDPIVYPSLDIIFDYQAYTFDVLGTLDLGQHAEGADVAYRVWYYNETIEKGLVKNVDMCNDCMCNEQGECSLSDMGLENLDIQEPGEDGPYFVQITVNDSCGNVYIATKAKWYNGDGERPKVDKVYLPKEISGFYKRKALEGDWTICTKQDVRTVSELDGNAYTIQTNVPKLEMLRRVESIRADLFYEYQKRSGKQVKLLC